MSDSTTELMRICFEKVELGGEDAVFFQNVINAFLEVGHESECRARLEEARVWLDKWRPLETKDLDWASGRGRHAATNGRSQRYGDFNDGRTGGNNLRPCRERPEGAFN